MNERLERIVLMIRTNKNLIAILLAAFAAGAIAWVGIPMFKAEATTTACFLEDRYQLYACRIVDPDDPWQLYPCGWYFGIWHYGQGGGETGYPCDCDHGINGFYVTFSVWDEEINLKVDEQLMSRDAILENCNGYPETHWCGVAHVAYGIFNYQFTCHYRDHNNVWQTHSSGQHYDVCDVEGCANPGTWKSDDCDPDN
jgi:hypothetical protein